MIRKIEVKPAQPAIRVFKTKAFSKLAKKAEIPDEELWDAAAALTKGQGDNLGGNVWKKRLNSNTHRSIVVEKVSDNWIFVFLFAKKDMANIDEDQLKKLKKLANDFGKMKQADIDSMIEAKDLQEVFGNDQDQIQE